MSPVPRPRGKLPARVYWFRRALVVAVALTLVFGVTRIVGAVTGGDDGDAGEENLTAQAAGGETKPSAQATQPIGPMPVSVKPRKKKKGKAKPTQTAAPLAQPTGPCRPEEITARPTVGRIPAGGQITIPLQLTGTQAACTFQVRPASLVVKVVSGEDRIWSTQECRRGIDVQKVVVRSAVPTVVEVTWHGRRSDETCSKQTKWAMPGYYHAIAAAIGSEPSDDQFQLVKPSRPIVIKTQKPKAKPKSD